MIPPPLKYILRTTGILHSWGHFFIFLFTAVLLCWNVVGVPSRIARCFGAIAFGFGLEWMEFWVYHNRLEWHDILVDSLGVLFGFIIVITLPILSSPDPRA